MNNQKPVPPIDKFNGRQAAGRQRALEDWQVYEARAVFHDNNKVKIAALAKQYCVSHQTMYEALAGRGAYKNV